MDVKDFLTTEECKLVLKKVNPNEQCEIFKYYFDNIDDLVEGFLSSSMKLIIEYEAVDYPGKKRRITLFSKILPKGNQFHEKYVQDTRCFEKEVFFFDQIKPNLDLWCETEVMPKCYFTASNRLILLDFIADGKVINISEYFTLKELKASIASISVIHSASLMCESKNSLDLISIWGDYFYEALYLRKEFHLGFNHTSTGIKAIKELLTTHYHEHDDEVKQKIFDLYDNLPELVLPSKRFRNVISHGDLYTNNIMFSTRSDQLTASIFDFQLFRFSPPALDLLMLIYLTFDLKNPEELDELTNYYYDQCTLNLIKFGFDITSELPRQEFNESLKYYKPLAIAITLLFQHYINLPDNTLNDIMKDSSNLTKFFLRDRSEIVLSCFMSDASYRNKVSKTIFHLVDSV